MLVVICIVVVCLVVFGELSRLLVSVVVVV